MKEKNQLINKLMDKVLKKKKNLYLIKLNL